ncbi:MAG: prenyltransferase [Proteobacteria bacterium]|nr:prenyltransferase [Pseudomonadota bacterium]
MKAKTYFKALRAPFLSGSVMPVLLGAAWANVSASFHWPHFILAVIGVAALHSGANLINDWADARGSDPINVRLTPFSGGSRVIQDDGLAAETVLKMSMLCYATALAVGLYMTLLYPWVGLLGVLGFLLGFLYSVNPFHLMSRGLGEAGIFFAFGPLVTLGGYYVIAGHMTWGAFFLGAPLGCLITAVVWINEFPDFQADSASGKHNLVVRLGMERARFVYAGLMAGAFVSLLLLVAAGFPAAMLLGLLATPLAAKAVRIFWRNYADHEGIVPAQALTIQTQLAVGGLSSLGLLLAAWPG